MTDIDQQISGDDILLTLTIQKANVEILSSVFSRLGSKASLLILLYLVEGPSTVEEVHGAMKASGFHAYRESTYKALEKLRDSGLVQKMYDSSRKALVYSLSAGVEDAGIVDDD